MRLWVLITLFISSFAHAQTRPQTPAQDRAATEQIRAISGQVINETLLSIQDLNLPCETCGVASAGEATRPPACQDTYLDVYRNDVVDFRFIVGYADYEHGVMDPGMYLATRDKLLQPCPGESEGACGFEQTDERYVLQKKVKGPDGREKTVRLTLRPSAESFNDGRNRGTYDKNYDCSRFPTDGSTPPGVGSQTAASCRAKNEFYDGLQNADMVIYLGHARSGGGPSFNPPNLLANGRVDLPGYRRAGIEAKKTVDTLRAAGPHATRMLGVFACDADTLFLNRFATEGSPRTGIVAGTDVSDTRLLHSQAFAMLDNVLARRCEQEFNRAMGAFSRMDGVSIRPPATRNLFRANPVRAVQTPPPQPVQTPVETPKPRLENADPALAPDAGSRVTIQPVAGDGPGRRIQITPVSETPAPAPVQTPTGSRK